MTGARSADARPGHRAARSAGLLLAAAMAAGLVGCAGQGPAYAPPSDDVAATVTATNNLSFEPTEVRIQAGQTVEWRNRSLFTHTVTMTDAKAAGRDDVQLPSGAQPFEAELPPGQVVRHTFKTPGTYAYVCDPHEALDMHGRVIVAATE